MVTAAPTIVTTHVSPPPPRVTPAKAGAQVPANSHRWAGQLGPSLRWDDTRGWGWIGATSSHHPNSNCPSSHSPFPQIPHPRNARYPAPIVISPRCRQPAGHRRSGGDSGGRLWSHSWGSSLGTPPTGSVDVAAGARHPRRGERGASRFANIYPEAPTALSARGTLLSPARYNREPQGGPGSPAA